MWLFPPFLNSRSRMNGSKLKETFTFDVWKAILTFLRLWCEAQYRCGTGSPEKFWQPHPCICWCCHEPQASRSTVWQLCPQQGSWNWMELVFMVLPTQSAQGFCDSCHSLPTQDLVCLGIPWSSPLSPRAHLPCTNISLLSLAPRIPRSPVQLINSEVRKERSIRDFSMSCLTRFPAPFYAGPTFSLAFLL